MPVVGLDRFVRACDRQKAEVRPVFAEHVAAFVTKAYQKPVAKMPVDTGRARASVRIGLDAPDLSIEGPGTYGFPAPGGQLGKLADLIRQPFRRIWVTNALPYMPALEYGHSKQAPAGVFRVSAAELQAEIGR